MTPRLAVLVAFAAFGTGFGTWAGTVATVADRSGVSAQTLGLAVTGFIAASLAGMAAGGALSRRFTVKRLLLASIAATAVSLPVLMQAASPLALAAGLVAFGLASGMVDGLMNAEGTAVERDMRRPVLAGFHAAASFAVAATAILGSMIAVRVGTGATAALVAGGYAAAFGAVLRLTPDRPVALQSRAAGPGRSGRLQPSLILVGLIVGISIAGETAAAMFSAPTLERQAPELASYAGAGATVFALCQGVMRSFADPIRRAAGDLRVIELSIAAAALGFAVVATSSTFAQSAAGLALVGLGTACLVPCGFSLAPRYSGIPAAQALGIVALVSALPRIPAPLIFGGIAERSSFAVAFAANAGLFLLALGLIAMLRRSRRAAEVDTAPGALAAECRS